MPNAVYEPSLPSPHDKPFMVFICLLYICHSGFIEVTRYGPRSNPPIVCCIWFWTRSLQVHVPKPKILAFIIAFFLTFQSSRRALGCLKPTFLIKSHVVTFYACARGEQISQCFWNPTTELGPTTHSSKIILLPQLLIDFLSKGMCR